MRVFVQMKSVGRRAKALEPIPYEIPDGVANLRQLISAFVHAEAESFNAKGTEVQLLAFLSTDQIDDAASAGKVGFGRLFNDEKANEEKAEAVALQAWQDGLVRVFLGEQELDNLDEALAIPPDSTFTFIRLAFLAGRMW